MEEKLISSRIKIIVVLYKYLYEKDDHYYHFGVIRVWNSSNLASIFNREFLVNLRVGPPSSTLRNFYAFSMDIHNPSNSREYFDAASMSHISVVLDKTKISKNTSESGLIDIFRSEFENAGGKDVNLIRVWKKN